jgi:hypothetical protein
LDIFLRAPNGDEIELSTDNGGGGDNFTSTVFTPTATTSITAGVAPFTGNFLPEQPFTNLAGSPRPGTWILRIQDDAGGDIGNLLNWSITFDQGTLASTWTQLSGPQTVAGFPYIGATPPAIPFPTTPGTVGTYRFNYRTEFANGCGVDIPVTVLVAEGNVWKGTVSNAWLNAGNWVFSPAPPNPGASVTIPNGTPFDPQITSAVQLTSLNLANNETVTLGTGGSLDLAGNIVGSTNGSVTGGLVTFSGTGVQTISGIVTVDGANVNNTDALTGLTFAPGGSLRVRPNGTLTMGVNSVITVPANGSLVLQSDATGTARLAQVPATATFNGNITMERWTPATAGWYFVGAPVRSAANLNEWFEMGARVTPANNSNIFEYNEPDTTSAIVNGTRVGGNGWKVPSAITNPINPIGVGGTIPKGYRIYLNSRFATGGTPRLSVTGPPIIGGASFPFTRTWGGFGDVAYTGGGWNLVSNPYPSEIDWNLVKNSVATSNPTAAFSDLVRIWNTAVNTYSEYSSVVGIGINGGSRYIASSQAFFIRATGAVNAVSPTQTTGEIDFVEAHKVVQPSTSFLRSSFDDNTMRVTLTGNNRSDQAMMAFRPIGSNGRDQYDGDKWAGSYVNVSFLPMAGLDFSTNVMGAFTAETVVPMNVQTPYTGQHTLSFEGIESFGTTSTIYLRDNYLNTLTDLTTATAYTFAVTNVPASQGRARFELVLNPARVTATKAVLKPGMSIWPNPTSGSTTLNVRLSNLGTGSATINLIDGVGRTVVTQSAALIDGVVETTLNIQALPAGVYHLRACSGQATITKEVVIK